VNVADTLRITLAGEPVDLLAERALYWPGAATLIVTDLHWGKAASFRALTIPVPSGTTTADLARLDRAIHRTGALRLLVLGDLLHAKAAQGAQHTLGAIREWRRAHAGLEVLLVRGNHDLRSGDPPADLEIRAVDALAEGPFAFRHHPAVPVTGYGLAGHLHPSIRLSGKGGDRVRLPCFHFGRRCGILPAFGSFTGTSTPPLEPGDRVYVIGEGEVVAVTGSPDASTGSCPAGYL
jgi:DNA ligase-associated metallophosphoesterase